MLAEFCQHLGAFTKLFDHFLPRHNAGDVAQGVGEPIPQQPGAHGGACAVEAADDGVPAVGPCGFEQFEIPLGDGVEHHEIGRAVNAQTVDVVGFPAERLLEIMQDCAGSADAHRQVAGAEAVERLSFEMIAQGEEGRLALEGPAVVRGKDEG